MGIDRGAIRRAAASCIAAIGLLPPAAQAQRARAADAWQWRASIYGWFPSISGSTSLPSGGSGPSIDFDAQDILSDLKFTFMGAVEARKGHWGAFTDLIYTDLDGSKSGSRDFTVGSAALPAGVDVNASVDTKMWIWTIAGTYAIARTPHYESEVLFGARMIDTTQKVDLTFNGNIAGTGLPGRSVSVEIESNNWDAIVGVKGVATLSGDGRWILPYYVDIGAGESKFTWQALLAVGYRFNWGTTTLGWRYLDYDMKSGDPIQDVNFSGAFVGLTFQW